MGRNKKHGNITLTDEDRIVLEKLSKSQTGQYRKVQRAKILLMSADGMLNREIAAAIGVHPNTAASIVPKYISAGKDYALNDASHSGKPNTMPKFLPIPYTVFWPVMRSSPIRSIIILSARIPILRQRCMTYWLSASR